jgi:hypothetical protein
MAGHSKPDPGSFGQEIEAFFSIDIDLTGHLF